MEKINSNFLISQLISWKTVFVLLAVHFVLFLYRKRHIFRFAWKNNGPKFPGYGQCKFLLEKDPFGIIKHISLKYGFPCNLWAGGKYIYVTIEPSEVKTILTSPLTHERADYYKEVLFKIFSCSLLDNRPYPLWKRDRKFINRQFSQSLFKYFVPNMYKASCKFGKDCDPLNGFFGISKHIIQLSFEAIAENVFRVNMNHLSSEVEEHIYSFQQTLINRKTSRLLGYNIWKKYTKSGQKFTKGMARYMDILIQMIEIYKLDKKDADESFESKFEGLIGAFLDDSEHNLTMEEFLHNISFLSLAAIDTSANGLAYTFLLLGMNPEIQEKVYQEVLRVVGAEKPILKDDLPHLKETERVILESLRIFPTAPIIGRKTTGDLNIGTKTIPKGCDITIPIFFVQRNEKYWPESEKFIPDRFLPQNVEKFEPGSYLPFVLGPRDCLGKTYALTFMKVFLASVIRHFKFSSNHTSISEFNFMSYMSMVPDTDLDIQVIPRDSLQ